VVLVVASNFAARFSSSFKIERRHSLRYHKFVRSGGSRLAVWC